MAAKICMDLYVQFRVSDGCCVVNCLLKVGLDLFR